MNEVIKNMMGRRSIRKYEDRQVPGEILEQILYAASFSPNAGNRQSTQIVICQDSEINDKLGRINKLAFRGRVSRIGYFVSESQPSIADDPRIDSAFYGAPTVITLFGPKNFLYAEADCWIMANNIALAAYSLDVDSCVVGRAEDTFASDLGIELHKKWNVPEGFEAKVHVALGYFAGTFPDGKPRKYPNPIIVR